MHNSPQLKKLVKRACGIALCVPLWVHADNSAGKYDSPQFLANDAQFSPWIYPLQYFAAHPGNYSYIWTMYCINVDYFAQISPADNQVLAHVKDPAMPMNQDVTRYVFNLMDNSNKINSLKVYYADGDWGADKLEKLLPNNAANAVISKGKQGKDWNSLTSHAKVFQASNNQNLYVSVSGSLNLQTVGLTAKANNALRFIETTPQLYNDFSNFSNSVVANDASNQFSGDGSLNSSGIKVPPVYINNYQVKFYAGRGNEFVGGNQTTETAPWPNYINPPVAHEHDKDVINWYDQVIYDAAKELKQGKTVNIYVAAFEIGQDSPFIDNLWRFAANGFENKHGPQRGDTTPLASQYPGQLHIYVLWQFHKVKNKKSADSIPTSLHGLFKHMLKDLKSDNDTQTTTTDLNNTSISVANGAYTLTAAQIWPVNDPKGPQTPQDMHNKFVIMDVVGHESERKLYVTSSNLDQPEVGSGKLWQVGTIISARKDSGIWSGANAATPNLWNAYKHYYDLLWDSRVNGKNPGQINFYKVIAKEHLAGKVNWIETVPTGKFNPAQAPQAGIDAFFYPVPFSATAPQ